MMTEQPSCGPCGRVRLGVHSRSVYQTVSHEALTTNGQTYTRPDRTLPSHTQYHLGTTYSTLVEPIQSTKIKGIVTF